MSEVDEQAGGNSEEREKELTVESFDEYIRVISTLLDPSLGAGQSPRRYFRGQARQARFWGLVPSIGRYDHLKALSKPELVRIENRVLSTFRNHLMAHMSHYPRDNWEVLAIAQHHGMPTRFMDFTTNPLVALYFATRETQLDHVNSPTMITGFPAWSPRVNSAVYVLNKDVAEYSTYFGSGAQQLIEPTTIECDIVYHPPHISPRIRAQDGVLLARTDPLKPLEDAECVEIVVLASGHKRIRSELERYGLFDKQLFPDLDGIAKWLRYREFEVHNGD